MSTGSLHDAKDSLLCLSPTYMYGSIAPYVVYNILSMGARVLLLTVTVVQYMNSISCTVAVYLSISFRSFQRRIGFRDRPGTVPNVGEIPNINHLS